MTKTAKVIIALLAAVVVFIVPSLVGGTCEAGAMESCETGGQVLVIAVIAWLVLVVVLSQVREP